MRVGMPGTPGRAPFAGHVRGVRRAGGVTLAWAGRLAAAVGPETGWEAAEALRTALAAVVPGARDAWLRATFTALRGLDARWLGREDLSLLLVAADADGARLTGVGLAEVRVRTATGWTSALPRTSPALTEPGPLPDAPAIEAPLRGGDTWIGLPPGIAFPTGDWARACGWH